MIGRLYRCLFPYSAKAAGAPGFSRDASGRFVSEHRRLVLDNARAMREAMPGHEWRHALPWEG